MHLNEYEKLAKRTNADQALILKRLTEAGPWIMQLDNGVRGLTDEVGELASIVKAFIEYGAPSLDVTHIKEEVGDALWRLSQICQAVGLSLEECCIANIAKLQKRYPNQYSDFRAHEQNRNRSTEREALEQNGNGWAEPAEESEQPATPFEPVVSFGDGLVRDDEEPYSTSYDRKCLHCKSFVHRTSSTQICPNCWAKGLR